MALEIGDTLEEVVNTNETESEEETEPADNSENTEKLGNTIMVSEISIFTLFVKNLQLNFDQCKETKFSEKDFRHYLFDYCSQVHKKNEGQEKL